MISNFMQLFCITENIFFFQESRDDTHMATGRRKKFDSVAKHARNKTFTEGVQIDPELLVGSSGSYNEYQSRWWKEKKVSG